MAKELRIVPQLTSADQSSYGNESNVFLLTMSSDSWLVKLNVNYTGHSMCHSAAAARST